MYYYSSEAVFLLCLFNPLLSKIKIAIVNKLTSVFHASVLSVVKVAVNPQTTLVVL